MQTTQCECLELCVVQGTGAGVVESAAHYVTINDIPAEARAMIAAWEARPPHEQRFQSYGGSCPSMSMTDFSNPPMRFRQRNVKCNKEIN